MKKILVLIPILLLLNFTSIHAQEFSFTPEKPKQGEKVIVKFNSGSLTLPEDAKPELVVYLYSEDLDDTKSVPLKKEGNNWTGSFSTDKSNYGALAIIKADELMFNNSRKGYLITLYDKKGNPVPGSRAGLGYGYYTWTAYYLGFDRNTQAAFELMNIDFEENPSIKTNFTAQFVPLFSTVNPSKMQDYLTEGTSLLSKKKNLTEEDYSTLVEFYGRMKDSVNAAKFETAAIEKFPKGSVVQMKEVARINSLTQEEKQLAIKDFGKKYPESRFLPGLHSPIIKAYLDKEEYAELEKFLNENTDAVNPYYFQNSASKILDKGGDLNIALSIADKGVQRIIKEQKTEKRPEYLSAKEFEESKEQNLAQTLFTKGRILYDLNRKNEAHNILKEAAAKASFKEPLMNYYYSKSLVEKEEYGEAFEKLSEFIRTGNSTNEMSGLLESAYIKMKGNSNGYDLFLSGLVKEANKKMAAKLQQEMIKEDAPAFTLTDLDGKEVSLGDYKGKVVMLDFWATWCGPCISSFPGLKKAVEKYSSNNDVIFLFINTRERVEDKKKNAADFITKNNYPFHVLLDLDSKVMENYKVSGIPTKFFIDKEGFIRFKSLGYSGNSEKMVSEIEAIISMLLDSENM